METKKITFERIMEKSTSEEKLNAIKKFLRENRIKYYENYYSEIHDVKMAIMIVKTRIAIFVSDGSEEFERGMVTAPSSTTGKPLRNLFNPFFIRDTETMDFTMEKLQNCIVNRMVAFNKKLLKDREKSGKER